MVINFDFRNGAKKSFGPPVAKLYALDYLWPSLGMVGNDETPRKNVFFKKCAETAVLRFFILWCEVNKSKNWSK